MSPYPALRRLAFRGVLLAALLLTPATAAPGHAGKSQSDPVTTLALNGTDSFLETAVLDSARGYLYFTAHDKEVVERIQLAGFSYDRAISLSAGYHGVASALDPSGDYAYFTTSSADGTTGQIVRLSLADAAISGTLALAPEDGIAVSLVVDAAGDYVYFGTNTQPGKVIQVRRSDFTRTATLALEAGEDDLRAAAIDSAAGYAYFGTRTQPGRVVRVRLADFARDGALTLPAGDDYLVSGVADPASGYAYFGTHTEPGHVARVGLAGFVYTGTLTLDEHGYAFTARLGVTSGAAAEYVYFGTGEDEPDLFGNNTPSRFVRIRQSDFPQFESLNLSIAAYGHVKALALDSDTAYAGNDVYWCNPRGMYCYWNQAEVARIDLDDFELIDSRYVGENLAMDVVMAGDRLIVDTATGQIVKFRLDDLSREASVNLPGENDALHRAFLNSSGEYVFIARDISPVEVLKVRVADLAIVDSLTLAAGEDGSRSVTLDAQREYAYFGTGAGQVVKVRLDDLSRIDALNVGSIAFCGGIDSTAGIAYFGLADGRAQRIRLSDFAVVDSLSLSDFPLAACIVDESGGYAYFAHDRPGNPLYDGMDVERVRLSDFSPAGSVHLRWIHWYAGEKHPNAAVLDPESGISYWTSWGTAWEPFMNTWLVGGVDAIRLEDFTALAWTPLNGYPWSIQLDESRHAAYFGILSAPGAVQRLDLDPQADVSAHGTAAPIGIQPGQALTYTFTVTSMGPHAATGVTLTATLPFGLTFVSASPGCAPAGLLVHCALPDLRAAASRAVTVTVRADGPLPPEPFVAAVQAAAQQPDGDPANNHTVVTATLVLPRAYLPVCGP